ncbi:uncharacterized protein LACBIDRAFT_334967 [Laccaria bicolor S238N-H82]|uniref:Predicted protein n=1 Tax=Laccaria bicolor (strain S238N-H82 / ATCC MYA-4686) TaxID=486041 RepID=B0E0X2_LACBS|nr:uncharacterized protein LACBIDRAFT_334967 [Laccaria bicolor S238N-H82]EDQ99475.1 predicted protein [Laccaria bicolor S238N-H82]|eukprot:XP_001889824.1 predicted protein [Laccaria bicolor S238N-H82]
MTNMAGCGIPKAKHVQGMLFDSGNEYNFKSVPMPFRPGIKEPVTVDDLYTPYWVHSQDDFNGWENLAKHKQQVTITTEHNTRFYAIHFADQAENSSKLWD